MSIPIVVITHIHISNGIDNVRNTRRITVLSCGILPPIKKIYIIIYYKYIEITKFISLQKILTKNINFKF